MSGEDQLSSALGYRFESAELLQRALTHRSFVNERSAAENNADAAATSSALLHNGKWVRHSGFRVEVKDTIGAGDSFLAALLTGILADRSNEEILSFAGAVGAYIATQDGATAKIDVETVRMLQQS